MNRGVVSGVQLATAKRRIGEQKRFEQTERRGRRMSILGLWQPDLGFEYALLLREFQE